MKGIVLEGLNSPFKVKDFNDPLPEKGYVLIRLKAAAFNHRDIWIRKGMYAGIKWPVIPGSDGAGVVVSIGDGVSKNWIGKDVIINPGMGWGDNPLAQGSGFHILGMPTFGTFAQYVAVPAEYIAIKPAYLTWEEAAALPLAGVTAWRALFTRGVLQKEDKVLITGIGGGVAITGLQFAKVSGADVFVTSGSKDKIDRALAMGASGGVNYRNENWTSELKSLGRGFDLVLDGAGGNGFSALLDLAAPGARIVIYGGTAGKIQDVSPQKIFWKQLSILGSTMGNFEDFVSMLEFAEKHSIRPVVDEVFPMERAEEAAKRLETGGQFGKIVLTIN